MQLKYFYCLSAHTIYWVGPTPQPSKQFLTFIGFFNVSYNIDLFNFPFAFLQTVTCF